jgi:hypothetical protein
MVALQYSSDGRPINDREEAGRIVEKVGIMGYQKINVELVAFSEEADAVVAELNSAIDRLEETYAIFGGGIETVPVAHSGKRKKSALRHTLDAGMRQRLRSNWRLKASPMPTRKSSDIHARSLSRPHRAPSLEGSSITPTEKSPARLRTPTGTWSYLEGEVLFRILCEYEFHCIGSKTIISVHFYIIRKKLPPA